MANRGEISVLLEKARSGDDEALGDVFSLLRSELRRIARRLKSDLASDSSLQSSDLFQDLFLKVHHVYASDNPPSAVNRIQFLTYAGKATKSLLIDHYKKKAAQKRGGPMRRTELEPILNQLECMLSPPMNESHSRDTPHEPDELPQMLEDLMPQLVGLGDILQELETDCPEEAMAFELKVFCGFSSSEIATWLNVSIKTVQRRTNEACNLLRQAILRGEE